MSWYKSTLKLLRESDESLMDIAKGADVGYNWLRRLMRGDYKDPSVNRIERIHKYLTRKRKAA